LERISIEDLQEHFDEVMDRVEDGESFIITNGGVDKAVLIPYSDYEELTQDEKNNDV